MASQEKMRYLLFNKIRDTTTTNPRPDCCPCRLATLALEKDGWKTHPRQQYPSWAAQYDEQTHLASSRSDAEPGGGKSFDG